MRFSLPAFLPSLARGLICRTPRRHFFTYKTNLSGLAKWISRNNHATQISRISIASKRFNDVTEQIVTKIESEIQMEKNAANSDDYNSNIKAYLEKSPFEIQDVPGLKDVTLTRKFEDESISVKFSISDIDNVQPREPYEDEMDPSVLDKPDDVQGSSSQANAPQSTQGSRDELAEESTDDMENVSFPCKLDIEIRRPDKPGFLHIVAIAEDGDIMIDSFSHVPEGSLREDDVYSGPPFNNLDEELQLLMVKFLEDRGIGTELALFIPEYVDWKEQREYVSWLSRVQGYVK